MMHCRKYVPSQQKERYTNTLNLYSFFFYWKLKSYMEIYSLKSKCVSHMTMILYIYIQFRAESLYRWHVKSVHYYCLFMTTIIMKAHGFTIFLAITLKLRKTNYAVKKRRSFLGNSTSQNKITVTVVPLSSRICM